MKRNKNALLNPDPDAQQSGTDPQGSWTGVPADPEETPVQDADDL